MAGRVTQAAIEALIVPDVPDARVTQVAVEALIAIGLLAGDAGITSGEAFGADGSVSADAGDLTLTGVDGIVSAEAFGVTDAWVNAPYIAGSAGIDESAMGSAGSLVAGLVAGDAGIATGEAFGADGALSGPITGAAGIDESAMGADGSVSGPITGAAGIASLEAFGAGVVAGPILGSTGISSLEEFGAGGELQQPVVGVSGIASLEGFGAGSVDAAMRGYIGITSAEKFGRRGAVLPERPYALYIRRRDWSSYLRVGTMKVTAEFGGRGQATFTLEQEGRGFRPATGDEVEYFCGRKKLFGGFLKSFDEEYFKANRHFELRCTATDYRDLCDVRTFARVYEGPTHTLSTIIGDLMAATLTAEGITYESREDYTITGGRIAFNDETAAQCLDRICAYFGCDWRIDHYRRLRVERRLADVAPRTLSDDDGNWEKMVVKRSEAQYRNRQGARTSTPTAGQRTATLAGAGAWSYALPFQVKGKPTVSVNDVAQTVVLYSQRHLGVWDFAYELDGSMLYHNPTQAAYTASDTIAVMALSGSLDVYWSQNSREIARRARQTGGSGIVEAVTPARNVRDQATARRFNEGMMRRLGQATVEVQVELTTLTMGPPAAHQEGRAGWDIGQMVSIACSRPLVFGDFLVKSMAFQEIGKDDRLSGGRFLRYQLTCVGRELPKIVAIEVSGGPDPGTWVVDVTVDRPVDWQPGDDISLWGINNTGADDPLNSSWPIDTIEPEVETGGVLIRFAPPDLDLTDWTLDVDGDGGEITTSGILPSSPDDAEDDDGGVEDPEEGGAGIIVNVNTTTREVTTLEPHGLSTTYPEFEGVAIVGVRGAQDHTHSINTAFTRITVTGDDTFIPEDVAPFDTLTVEPFENDRRGRVYGSDLSPRPLPGNPDATNILSTLNAAGTEDNTQGGNATFLLANSVPGFASRPLMVMSAATNPWIQQRDLQVVESVNVEVGTPSQGGPIRIDIKKNGASIFAAGYVEIPAGETSLRTSELVSSPLTVEKDDRLQPDVVAVGSEFPGCNVRVDVVLRG